MSVTSPKLLLDILVHERSLSRGVPPSYPPPERFFHPGNYNFGRYFTAFESDKLKMRSNAIHWFSCSVIVCHSKPKPNQKNTQSPPNPTLIALY